MKSNIFRAHKNKIPPRGSMKREAVATSNTMPMDHGMVDDDNDISQ